MKGDCDGHPQSAELDLGNFVRHAAHDLANAFNAITMNTDVAKLLLERQLHANLAQTLDGLVADCANCGRMIQGMQRFGAGIDTHARERMHVCEWIDKSIVMAACESVRIRRIDDIDGQVTADASAMHEVVAGILRNAVEAGADVIEIRLRRVDGRIAIGFVDNGSGIPAELGALVTEAFFTTRRGKGHIGLGLTLAREQALRHGGSLTIAPNPPGGAHIELRLPEAMVPA